MQGLFKSNGKIYAVITNKDGKEYSFKTGQMIAQGITLTEISIEKQFIEFTHDKDCNSQSCANLLSTRRLCLIAQRAMKQMTGYFGGYISKKQRIGKFEIKKSVSALPLLREKIQNNYR